MPSAPEPLLRAKELIDTRYFEPLDVRALARAARLSPAHFSREFRRAFGEPPHQYLIARRMERAAALLQTSDQPVAEACRNVGLRSVGSFTSCFTRTFGEPPASYRAARRTARRVLAQCAHEHRHVVGGHPAAERPCERDEDRLKAGPAHHAHHAVAAGSALIGDIERRTASIHRVRSSSHSRTVATTRTRPIATCATTMGHLWLRLAGGRAARRVMPRP